MICPLDLSLIVPVDMHKTKMYHSMTNSLHCHSTAVRVAIGQSVGMICQQDEYDYVSMYVVCSIYAT